MKKIIVLTLVLIMALGVFAGCAGGTDDKTIVIAASPTPHAEILEIDEYRVDEYHPERLIAPIGKRKADAGAKLPASAGGSAELCAENH